MLNFKANKGIRIDELYGTIAMKGIPHGRSNKATPNIDKKAALQYKKRVDEYGLKFAYLINAPINSDNLESFTAEIDWIVNVFKASSITITSVRLMELVRRRYPDFRINISTIAGIKSVEDIRKYTDIRPQKVILHHDVNRNFKDLERLLKFCGDNNIELEIMLNESCLRRCVRRDAHYNTLGKECDDGEFHVWCNKNKVSNPYQLLLANFIRPEDMALYESLGVTSFKITGRSKPEGWLAEVVKAYIEGDYDSNLVRLLGIDPKLKAEEWIYISNKSLEGFIDRFPKSGEVQDEISYCSDWIMKLFENNQFKIAKGGIKPYTLNNELRFQIDRNLYD